MNRIKIVFIMSLCAIALNSLAQSDEPINEDSLRYLNLNELEIIDFSKDKESIISVLILNNDSSQELVKLNEKGILVNSVLIEAEGNNGSLYSPNRRCLSIIKEEKIFQKLHEDPKRISFAISDVELKETTLVLNLSDEIKGNINDIIALKNGDYLLGGSIMRQEKNTDFLIIRIDAKGELLWRQQFGSRNGDDVVFDLYETESGQLLYAGTTDDFNTKNYFSFVGGLNSNGKNVWEKTFGDLQSKRKAKMIRPTKEGYTILETEDEQTYVLKIDKQRDFVNRILIDNDVFSYLNECK